jgi:hypothetical protein
MQHKPLEQLQQIAEIHPDQPGRPMTREERLERWAQLLEREPDRQLGTFAGTEYQPREARDQMRGLASAISIAFEDPILRADGLANDTYGEAKRFFELTDWQLHNIICQCHHGARTTARIAASHVRAAVRVPGGMFARLRQAVVC